MNRDSDYTATRAMGLCDCLRCGAVVYGAQKAQHNKWHRMFGMSLDEPPERSSRIGGQEGTTGD